MRAARHRLRTSVLCVLVASAAVACSAGDPEAAPTPATSSSASSTVTSSPSATPSGPTQPPGRDLDVDVLVVPPAASTLPAAWRERFVVGYGPGPALLGTAPGGDSGTLDVGPEYGAPAPDGTWWFLDAAKARLAHYDSAGRYLDQVRIGRDLLVDGRYFQWQLPHVLADGTLVAVRQTSRGTALLRLRDGVLDEVVLRGSFAPTYDDGRRLYGFTGAGRPVSVDPADESMRPARRFPTPAGTSLSLEVGRRLGVTLAGATTALPIRTASGAPAHVGVQVRAGTDGALHLYLTGSGEDDESTQLVGATQVAPGGRVAEVEALPNPFSASDPGSPAQLVMAPGTSEPLLVYVLTDGVHVYERTG